MTLIATPGAVDANSFVTLAYALDVLELRPGGAAFTDAPDTPQGQRRRQQEGWLIQATDLITRRVVWLDVPANPLDLVEPEVQALPLPMAGQVDAMGRLLAEDIVPPMVQQATALLALALAQEHTRSVATADMVGLQRVKMGDIEVQLSSTQPVSVLVTLPAEVWELLAPYGQVPVRGMQMPVYRG